MKKYIFQDDLQNNAFFDIILDDVINNNIDYIICNDKALTNPICVLVKYDTYKDFLWENLKLEIGIG